MAYRSNVPYRTYTPMREPPAPARALVRRDAGAASRARQYSTISSTRAPLERGKTKRYFGPLPAVGKMTTFSERNFGSRATTKPSRSIVWEIPRPPFRPTKTSLRGSSFVATSAPKRFGAMRRPRPLMQGTAQAIVSLSTFCWLKTPANFEGKRDRQGRRRTRISRAVQFFENKPNLCLHRAQNSWARNRGRRRARARKRRARRPGCNE